MRDWDVVDFGELTCREFVELVTDYLEDELGPDLRRRFETHVAGCPGCERYLDQVRATQRALGRVPLEALSPGARDQLMTAFRDWRSAGPGRAPS